MSKGKDLIHGFSYFYYGSQYLSADRQASFYKLILKKLVLTTIITFGNTKVSKTGYLAKMRIFWGGNLCGFITFERKVDPGFFAR